MESLTLAPGSDRIPVELFPILKDDAVESAALNMQYAICTQYAICNMHSICNMQAPGIFPFISADRHLGGLYILTIINSASVNFEVHVYFFFF